MACRRVAAGGGEAVDAAADAGGAGAAGAGTGGASAQPTSASAAPPRIPASAALPRAHPLATDPSRMALILLEALLALALLVFIVWWTMFSGRKKGEPPREDER